MEKGNEFTINGITYQFTAEVDPDDMTDLTLAPSEKEQAARLAVCKEFEKAILEYINNH